MRILLVLFALFTLSFILPDNDVILWKKDRPLTWDDFKGKPPKRFAVASTNYDILQKVLSINKDSSCVEVKAVFFSNKSWKREKWIDKTVLIHEQKHFDIVELYARKLRKLIRSNTYKSEKSRLSLLHHRQGNGCLPG